MGLTNDLTLLAASEMNYRHRVEHLQRLGRVGPNPAMREVIRAEQEMRRERKARSAPRTPMPTWTFWVLATIGALAALTVIGLPLTALVGALMWWKHPWLPAQTDARTVVIPTVGTGRHAR